MTVHTPGPNRIDSWDRCICAECWATYDAARRRSVARHKIERATYAGCEQAAALIETFLALGHPIRWTDFFAWTTEPLEKCGLLRRLNGAWVYDPQAVIA